VTYMFILKCALKLVLKNILYYDARSEKHQINSLCVGLLSVCIQNRFSLPSAIVEYHNNDRIFGIIVQNFSIDKATPK